MKPEPPAWQSADFQLPGASHMPVEVELTDGKREKRKTVEGDWREVKRWRKLKP